MRLIKIATFVGMIFLAVTAGLISSAYIKQRDVVVPAGLSGNISNIADGIQLEDNIKRKEPLKIAAVGDILLGRGVGNRIISQHGGDFTYPFRKVEGILKTADVVFANLESPISDRGVPVDGKPITLRSGTKAFEAVRAAGFNLLNLANNHVMDYGDEALYDTLDILSKNGIAFAGAGRNIEEARKAAILEKKGYKIGMLAYTDMAYIRFGGPESYAAASSTKPGVAPLDDLMIKEDIGKLKGKVDILIVSLHWGTEDSFKVSGEQRQMAHELIDSGADIIIGHHPHQFQGIEVYKGRPVMYSLGNFIFDQNDPENQESFIVNIEYEENEFTKLYAIPVRTVGKTQVVPQSEKEAADMLRREEQLSRELGSECEIVDGILSLTFEKEKPPYFAE